MKNQWLINNMEPYLHNVWVKPSCQAWKCQEHLGCVGCGSKFLMACAWGIVWMELFVITIFLWEAQMTLFTPSHTWCRMPSTCALLQSELGLVRLSEPWGIQRLGPTFPSENTLGRVKLHNFLPWVWGAPFLVTITLMKWMDNILLSVMTSVPINL